MLAGMLAGKMFGLIDYLGIACALYLLGYLYTKAGRTVLRQPLFWIVAIMFAFTLANEFGFQPAMAGLKALVSPADIMHSAYAGKFKMLHGIASICYLLQSLLGIALILTMARPGSDKQKP